MDRKQAHIEKIFNFRSIEGKDLIEQANVLGWNLIIKKGDFQENDLCVYIEIDSIVPSDNETFSFLEKRNYKIKTMKMAGVISQGIAFPLSILPKGNYKEGDDVTSILKIKKIEDETPEISNQSKEQKIKNVKNIFTKSWLGKKLMKYQWYRNLIFKLFVPKVKKHLYPSYIIKTDETRLQANPDWLEQYKGIAMQVTEKIDGTSTTFGLEKKGSKFDYAVCSRNVRQNGNKDPRKCFYDDNYYMMMSQKYNIEEIMLNLFTELNCKSTLVLQGETHGIGIQSNKYKEKENDIHFFNLVIDGIKLDSVKSKNILEKYNLKWVPILETEFILKDTIEEMIEYSKGKSTLYDTLREGIVIRDMNNTVSFKVINPDFLIKWDL